MGALALFLLRSVADDGATTALPLPHDYCLDPRVVCPLLIAARALEDPGGHLITAAPRPAQAVLPPALAERFEVVLCDPPGIAHQDTTAQVPPAPIVLPLGNGADIHRMPRQHPGPHRQAIAGHRQPDHDLRGLRAAILRQAPFAGRFVGLGTRRRLPSTRASSPWPWSSSSISPGHDVVG